MTVPILLLLAGFVLLTLGAEALVRGSASLALRFGIPSLIVGLTVVAYGTSAPELLVTLRASLEGRGGIAAGNVVGSNIFNVAVILGLSALLRPIRVDAQVLRFEAPLVLGVSLLLVPVFADGAVSRVEAVLLALGAVAYSGFQVSLARRIVATDRPLAREAAAELPKPTRSLAGDLFFMVLGLALLVYGAALLVDNAVILARRFGWSEALIGLTIISAGTSLPELATSLVAAVRKHADIALGNILGSNLFNILLILGATGVIRPFAADGITPLDLAYSIGLVAVLPVLLFTRRTLERWEGALLVASYGVYLTFLWPTGG
jgi:cation:H+ antiporter